MTEIDGPAVRAPDFPVGPFAEGDTLNIEALPYNRMTVKKAKLERFATLYVGPVAPSGAGSR